MFFTFIKPPFYLAPKLQPLNTVFSSLFISFDVPVNNKTQILDQLLISSEYKCRSAFWQTEYYAVVYLIFNLIWYYEGPLESRVLYTILDWEDDGGMATLFIFLIFFILVPIFSTMHYGVYR